VTYYDDFEMDCGCRMHCRCGQNDGGKKLAETQETKERLAADNRRLREENTRLEAELAWRRPKEAA
jgi:hypothetical protein